MNAFQRSFVSEVKRADEMERKLRFFDQLIEKTNKEADLGGAPIPVAPAPTDGKDRTLSMDELEVRSLCVLVEPVVPTEVTLFRQLAHPFCAGALRGA